MSPWDIPVFRMAYFAIPHRIGFSSRSGVPPGLLADFAPSRLTACWCSAGLIGSAKRSGFSRFAASIRAHCAFSSKTLMLQVHFAHPPSPHRNLLSEGSGVPHGLFMISHHRPCGRWCFARLIRQAETLELQLHSQPPSKRTALSPLKRSCFRFAALTLRCRTPLSCPSRIDLSSVQKTPHLFSDGQTGYSSARTLLFPLPG